MTKTLTPILHLKPLPPTSQDPKLWARAAAHIAAVPPGLVESYRGLSPDARTECCFSFGAKTAIHQVLRAARAQRLALPYAGRGLSKYVDSLVAALPIPPAAAFGRPASRSLPGIYRAGLEAGLLIAVGKLHIPNPPPRKPYVFVRHCPKCDHCLEIIDKGTPIVCPACGFSGLLPRWILPNNARRQRRHAKGAAK